MLYYVVASVGNRVCSTGIGEDAQKAQFHNSTRAHLLLSPLFPSPPTPLPTDPLHHCHNSPLHITPAAHHHCHTSPLPQVRFTADGNFLLSGARQDGSLVVWDLRCGAEGELYRLPRDTASTNQRIGFSVEPCGRHVASGGSDGCVRVYDLQVGAHGTRQQGTGAIRVRTHHIVMATV